MLRTIVLGNVMDRLYQEKITIIVKLLYFISGCILSAQVGAGESSVIHSPIPAVDCVINPYRVADLASPVPGVIETLYVERSQQVSAGQVVAQLTADVERANVELARFRAGIQSEIRLGQVSLTFDKRRKQRVDSLHEKQVVSVENTDEAEREAGLSKWKLEQARELADIRKLELRRAEEQLRQKSIKAPFDGFVLDTFKYSGEYVEDQAILRLAQLDPLVVEAIVPMENFGEIAIGMQAEILPEGQSGETLRGKVTIVDRIGDTASNTFGVRLVMPNPENHTPAGLKCVVKFLQQSAGQALAGDTQNDAGPVIRAVAEDVTDAAAVAVEANVDTPIAGVGTDEPGDTTGEGTEIATIPVAQTPTGYMVVTPQAETGQQTRDIIASLRQAGIRDLQKMDHGPYNGLIILGLYRTRGAAEQRQQVLEKLGITPFIRERY